MKIGYDKQNIANASTSPALRLEVIDKESDVLVFLRLGGACFATLPRVFWRWNAWEQCGRALIVA